MTARWLAESIPPMVALLERRFEDTPGLPPEEAGADREGLDPALWGEVLLDPVEDMLARPGKRFRARLVEASWALGGGEPARIPADLPWLVELLHAGSLVVDDIEDDGVHRRGDLALHRRHGLPLALNAGNWLYFFPLHLLSTLGLPAEAELSLHRRASAALLRCHQGQALDLGVRVHELPPRRVRAVVHRLTELKTGALMELSAAMGVIAAGGDDARVAAVSRFGRELGVGLQMLDDLSGVLVDARVDKGVEDLLHTRATWPWAWLAEDGDQVAYAEARRLARGLERGAGLAELLAHMRFHVAHVGRRRVREHLDRAVGGLRTAVPEHDAIEAIAAEVDRLEKSYG